MKQKYIHPCFSVSVVQAFAQRSKRGHWGAPLKILLLAAALIFIAATERAQARNVELNFSIADAMADAELRQKIGTDVAFFFGNQPSPPIVKTFGEFVTNKKTNAFGKPDAVACRWAMLSALIQLHERAKELGANAVVNIVSYYNKNSSSSTTEYVCHAGNVVAGVALKGTFVSLGPQAK